MPEVMHIVLHLALCGASAGHAVHPVKAVHVELDYHNRRPAFEQVLPIDTDDPSDTVVEFDVERGVYLMTVNEPQSSCGATEYVDIIPGGNRDITLRLHPHGTSLPPNIPTLFSGTTPLGFTYAEPSVVLLNSSVQCNQPIGDPIPMNSATENDDNGYYTSIFSYESPVGEKPQIALRLTDNAGDYHYVRMSIPLSQAGQVWPNEARFDVDQDTIDYVVGKSEDTLLCPKLYKTSVGG